MGFEGFETKLGLLLLDLPPRLVVIMAENDLVGELSIIMSGEVEITR